MGTLPIIKECTEFISSSVSLLTLNLCAGGWLKENLSFYVIFVNEPNDQILSFSKAPSVNRVNFWIWNLPFKIKSDYLLHILPVVPYVYKTLKKTRY